MQDESIETNLPRTIPEWKARAKTLKVLTKCPNDLKILSSGSKVTFKEYLTMRIIRPEVQAIEIFPHDYSSEAEAKKIIKADTTFEKWFSKVETNIRPDKDLLGMFALVKFAQLQVTKHESLESPEPPFERAKLRPRPSVPVEGSSEDAQHETSTPASAGTRVTPAEDTPWARFSRTDAEEEVNFFLLNLLNAFTLSLNPDIRCEWSAHRNPFHAVSFGEIDMTTHVDGYLRAIGKDEAFAILEVKAAERNHRNAPQVMWQEGAEMVAWILCDESKNREYPFSNRLLISQNRKEIFLTLASYTSKDIYPKFLKGELGASNNYSADRFLTMQEYGPWLIDKKTHMQDLALIIMGFCLRVSGWIEHHT